MHSLRTTLRPVIVPTKGLLVADLRLLALGAPPSVPSSGNDDCGLPCRLGSESVDSRCICWDVPVRPGRYCRLRNAF